MSTSPRKRKASGVDDMDDGLPANSLVTPMLTDMYQLSMSYAYWKADKHNDATVFDLFFRKCPFKGEFCIFGGLEECLRLCKNFAYTGDDIAYIKTLLPDTTENEYFEWLAGLDCKDVKIYAVKEGSLVFPKQPLLRLEGPLGICQLLETTLLNLVNYPSLIATNAARIRLAAGPGVSLLEFGLRRAQGPDGAISASKYAYMGGFDGTSNVAVGKMTGITVKGTHAHAYVMSYTGLNDLKTTTIASSTETSKQVEFLAVVLKHRKTLVGDKQTNEGELAAFVSYAQAYPKGFLALVDTYDTLQSGVPNYLAVARALHDLGYKSLGIRLDSGDLAYLSKRARMMFADADKLWGGAVVSGMDQIVASNDLNEDVILSLNRQGHEINCFGVGTNLVTCLSQPALGCVYKLVEINGAPRIKLSQEVEKLVIPGKKELYRFYGADGKPLLDVMQLASEPVPVENKRMLVRHPFTENKRAYVTPAKVEKLLEVVWDGQKGGIVSSPDSLKTCRQRCMDELANIRQDHIRNTNATPYKTSVTTTLYDFIHELWLANAPVQDLT
jgi:nicotinate phosphoribosyltransferase